LRAAHPRTRNEHGWVGSAAALYGHGAPFGAKSPDPALNTSGAQLTIQELWQAELDRHHVELAAYYRRFRREKYETRCRKPRLTGYVRQLWATIDELERKLA
jgi:hypothetical protein